MAAQGFGILHGASFAAQQGHYRGNGCDLFFIFHSIFFKKSESASDSSRDISMFFGWQAFAFGTQNFQGVDQAFAGFRRFDHCIHVATGSCYVGIIELFFVDSNHLGAFGIFIFGFGNFFAEDDMAAP